MEASTIINQARTWLDTPYVHQGRVKGVGVDCIGLVNGIALELDLYENTSWDYTRFRELSKIHKAYRRVPQGTALYQCLKSYAPEYPPNQMQPSDILLVSFKGKPRHTAILTDRGTVIHAYAEANRCVENSIDFWRSSIVGTFRFREVFDG